MSIALGSSNRAPHVRKEETSIERGQLQPEGFEVAWPISRRGGVTSLMVDDEPICDANLRRGLDVIVSIWSPHLSTESLRMLAEIFAARGLDPDARPAPVTATSPPARKTAKPIPPSPKRAGRRPREAATRLRR
jgi:hypothetical protein